MRRTIIAHIEPLLNTKEKAKGKIETCPFQAWLINSFGSSFIFEEIVRLMSKRFCLTLV